jgi:plastocyanin
MGIDMTAIRQEETTTLQADGPRLGRSYAMTVVSGGCFAMAGILAFFIVALVLPAADESIGAIVPIFGAFIALFVAIGAVSVFWAGAQRQAWFWLVAAVPALLLLVMNARHISYDGAHPANTSPFLVTIVFLAAAVAVIVGGIAAFLDVRRGRSTWTRAGRAGWVVTVVIGAVVGAGTTSLLAGSAASAARAGVAEAPTTTGTITAQDVKFVETSVTMNDGEILGLFVINRDSIPHAFEVDSLSVHVQLPPNSTTAVAIKPSGPGTLQFYCGLGGHREAGMVGTISVD